MNPLLHFAQAATSGTTTAVLEPPTEALLRFLVFPLVILVVGMILKGIAELREEHLTHVRLVHALLHQLEVARQSWQENKQAFEIAHRDGLFARRVEADTKYFLYSVTTKSTMTVFSAEGSPAKSFSFLNSETLKHLVTFHDNAELLNSSIADLREDAFRELAKDRKLAALGKIVDLFQRAEDGYPPCKRCLDEERAAFTDTSLKWLLLFPWRSTRGLACLLVAWIVANAAWQRWH
jgi:hypothetical protein